MGSKEYVIGQKFGRLLIVNDAEYNRPYKRRVSCVCDCGKEYTADLTNLKTGHTQSCGCFNLEVRVKTKTTHGMSYSPEYKSYRKMIERCTDNNDISYHNYGGRGINVCDRWLNGFEYFLEDMGLKPTSKHSLERSNTNGHYEPDNCCWATKKTQCNNTRVNKVLEYRGVKKNQGQWAQELGVSYYKIAWHLKKGQSFEAIVDYIKNNPGKRLMMKIASSK